MRADQSLEIRTLATDTVYVTPSTLPGPGTFDPNDVHVLVIDFHAFGSEFDNLIKRNDFLGVVRFSQVAYAGKFGFSGTPEENIFVTFQGGLFKDEFVVVSFTWDEGRPETMEKQPDQTLGVIAMYDGYFEIEMGIQYKWKAVVLEKGRSLRMDFVVDRRVLASTVVRLVEDAPGA